MSLQGQHYATLGEIAKSKITCRPDDRDEKPTVCTIVKFNLTLKDVPTTPSYVCETGQEFWQKHDNSR